MKRALTMISLIAATLAASTALAGGASSEQGAAAREPDRVCGILPGEGAYSYIKVWNVPCREARKVASKAYKKFCEPNYEGCFLMPGESKQGMVKIEGWGCEVKAGYEFSRESCRDGKRRFTSESAA